MDRDMITKCAIGVVVVFSMILLAWQGYVGITDNLSLRTENARLEAKLEVYGEDKYLVPCIEILGLLGAKEGVEYE